MSNRIEWAKHAPEAYKAMVGLEMALGKSGLENSLLELIRLRASQINGCAYCVNMHANDARKAGETEARLQTLSVWEETAYFTPRERAALAWTEAATRLEDGEVTDAVFLPLQELFSEREISDLGFATAMMNAWNRMAIGFRQPVARAAFP